MTSNHTHTSNGKRRTPDGLWGLLEHIGLTDIHDRGGEIGARCPVHPHHENNPKHWSINKTTGLHSCFSCSFKGNLPQLVMEVAELDMWSALRLIHECGVDLEDIQPGESSDDYQLSDFTKQFMEFLDNTVEVPEYALESRHISAESAKDYGLYWFEDPPAWGIPVRGDRHVWGYQTKPFDGSSPRTSKGTHTGKTLFGWHERLGWHTYPIIVVESPLDVVYIHEMGYRYHAVATFGVPMTKHQVQLLIKHRGEVILALDNDDAGEKETNQVIPLLAAANIPTKLLIYPDGVKDAGECTPEEFKEAFENAAPLQLSRVDRLSDVEAQPVNWTWMHWIPQGELVILEGRKGLGKSTLVCDIAARVTTGDLMPDGTPGVDAVDVLYLAGEESVEKVIKRRLELMGADTSKVLMLNKVTPPGQPERDFTIPGDIDEISRLVAKYRPGLLIIDVINNFLGDKVDTDGDHSIRRALRPLAEMAQKYGISIIALRHLRKSREGAALDQGIGSVGIAGQARAVIRADYHPDQNDQRVLAMVESNLGPKPVSQGYVMDPKQDEFGHLPVVRWTGPESVTADELASASPGGASKVHQAEEWLKCVLSDHKDGISANDVFSMAAEEGITQMTLTRARKNLGIQPEPVKDGKGKVGGWIWRSPTHNADPVETTEVDPDDGVPQAKVIHLAPANRPRRPVRRPSARKN